MNFQTDRDQAVRKLAELIGAIRVAMLTTVGEDGRLRNRPVTTRPAAFDGDLWFLTRADSPKAREVGRDARVCLTYARPGENAYVCVSGTAEVVTDPGRAEQLWEPSYLRWFPGGPCDPDLALFRVAVERAESWDAPALTWPTEAGFVVLAPGQRDDPAFHARIGFPNSDAPPA
jgi:general stress protein 26